MVMKNRILGPAAYLLTCLALVAAALLPGPSLANNLVSGAVYVMTNQVNNAVVAFQRGPDGSLSEVGQFLTGGAGAPTPMQGDPATDPLASQGSLIRSDDGRFLFAVNAGSDEISVLAIGEKGLTLVDKVPSGGDRPISLTLHGDLLYVLNEGSTPNITGFLVASDGTLQPLAGSTRPLARGLTADLAQIGFTPAGSQLRVLYKADGDWGIETFDIDLDGLSMAPTRTPTPGRTLFGFAFDNRGIMVVAEAFSGTTGGAAVSSYDISENGALTVISESVRSGQVAPCWIVITNDGRYVYTSNSGSDTISSYRISPNGTLTLLNSVAAFTGPGSAPIDMAMNNGSGFLYLLGDGSHKVHAFCVESDGSLTSLGAFGSLPSGSQGIAAR